MGILARLFPPAKPDKFAQMAITELRRQGVTDSIRYDADNFKLMIGEGDEAAFFLSITTSGTTRAWRTG